MNYLFIILIVAFNLKAVTIEAQQLFNKKIVTVKEREIRLKKTFYGKTAIIESNIMDINTRYNGFIHKLYANKTLMYIDKNKPLFSIYSNEIISVQEELLLAKKLKKNNTIFKSAYNKLAALDLDKRTLKKLKSSTKLIENINIYSPVNGFLIKKNVNNKSYIQKGKLIFQIADLSKLWLIVQVYQKDIRFISKDMKAKIYIDGLKDPIMAKLDYIYPIINSNKQTVDLRFTINNTNLNMYPNMFSRVDLYKPSKTMLTLPRSSVLTKGDKHFVFRPLNDKEFEPVLVTAKRIDSKTFAILSGLNRGDKVIDKVLFMLDSDAITNGLYDSDEDDEW